MKQIRYCFADFVTFSGFFLWHASCVGIRETYNTVKECLK